MRQNQFPIYDFLSHCLFIMKCNAPIDLRSNLTHCSLVMPYCVGDLATQVYILACCLVAPSHCLNLCWFIISGVLWYSPKNNFTGRAQDINLHNEFKFDAIEIVAASPRHQWVKPNQSMSDADTIYISSLARGSIVSRDQYSLRTL